MIREVYAQGQSVMFAFVGSGFNGVLVRCEVCLVRSSTVSVGVPPCSWTCRTVSCLGTDSQGRRSGRRRGGRWHVGLCVHLVTLSVFDGVGISPAYAIPVFVSNSQPLFLVLILEHIPAIHQSFFFIWFRSHSVSQTFFCHNFSAKFMCMD